MTSAFPTIPLDNPDVRYNLRTVLEKYSSGAAIRRSEAAGGVPDADLWGELVRGGWTGLALPEAVGGAGMPVSDLQLALYELGYAAAPVPYRSSVVLTGWFLAVTTEGDAARDIAESIVAGQVWSPAVTEGRWLESIETTFDGKRVSGRKAFVPDAGAAASFLVLARDRAGAPAWLAVDAGAEGVELAAMANTGNDAQYELTFRDAPARQVASVPAEWWLALERFAAASWAHGLMTHAMEIAVEHVKTRVQFGKPIGAFQAVQHRLADSAIELQASLNMARSLALAIGESGLTDPAIRTHIAELAYASRRAAWRACRDTHQVLGGLGYSLEHDLHLYTRRIKAYSILGDLDDVLTEEIAAANFEQFHA